MTVIVWDGETLAADKRAQNVIAFSVTKIEKINGALVGACDSLDSCRMIMDWYRQGADPKFWPDCQKDKELWAPMIVITPDKKIWRYERQPIPYEVEDSFIAIGSGKELATGAMAMGATAIKAVEIACMYDPGCGNGIDTMQLDQSSNKSGGSDE